MRSTPEWIGKRDETQPPPRVIARLALEQGGRCACGCTRKFSPRDKPQADHIIALINGGENRESNLQLLIEACHRKKTRKDVAIKSKTARIQKRNLGLKKRSTFANSKDGKWKTRLTANGPLTVPR